MSYRKVVGGLVITLAVVACSDLRDGETIVSPDSPAFSHIVDCDLHDTRLTAQAYLSPPEQQVVAGLIRDIEDAGCDTADGRVLALQALGVLEDVLWADLGGSPEDGASVATDLAHCCLPGADDVTVGVESFSEGGIFWVRSNHALSDPVITREPVNVLIPDEEGGSDSQPGVVVIAPEAGEDWDDVFPAGVEFIHGGWQGLAPYPSLEVNEAASLGFLLGAQVRVVFCFTADVPLPGAEELPTVTRNGAILPPDPTAVDLCDEAEDVWEVAASPVQRLVRWAAQLVLPQPLVARQGWVGWTGLPSGFSELAVLNADGNGMLDWEQQAPPRVTVGEPFTVSVKAFSGGGTEIAGVEVLFGIAQNNGENGTHEGIVLGPWEDCAGDDQSYPVSCTDQSNGEAAIVLGVDSPGAYTLIAETLSELWNLVPATSRKFNANNP